MRPSLHKVAKFCFKNRERENQCYEGVHVIPDSNYQAGNLSREGRLVRYKILFKRLRSSQNWLLWLWIVYQSQLSFFFHLLSLQPLMESSKLTRNAWTVSRLRSSYKPSSVCYPLFDYVLSRLKTLDWLLLCKVIACNGVELVICSVTVTWI